MRNLYIIPKHLVPSVITYCSLWHGTELASGEVLVSVQFTHDYSQREFESHPNVQAVGAEYDGSPIADEHAAKLAEHGVKKGHTAKDIRKLAQVHNRLM